jgi:hypothetical protein
LSRGLAKASVHNKTATIRSSISYPYYKTLSGRLETRELCLLQAKARIPFGLSGMATNYLITFSGGNCYDVGKFAVPLRYQNEV